MHNNINEHIKLVNEIDLSHVEKLAELIKDRIENGNKVLICGNGGSAADAQHFAAELIGRFQKERAPMPAIALTTDTSIITAISNDYGYEYVFSRQVEGLANENDVLIAISTSGGSLSIYNAIEAAKKIKCTSIALTGAPILRNICSRTADYSITIDSKVTARVQEMHILILHLLAEKIEE